VHVLVAGGAGFIGSHVCRELLTRGHSVTCLDNLVTGQRENLVDLDGRPGFAFVDSDVAGAPGMAVDLVLHMASPASPVDFPKMPIEILRANSVGTERLLQVAREAGARFVFASTSEVYGDPLEHPQKESYRGNVNPIGPRACYDEGKRFGEAMTFAYRQQHGVNASIVRIFNTYGPGMRLDDGRVIPAFVAAALRGEPLRIHGDGSQTRSFCYVSDLIDGIVLVALDFGADGEVFNIGNPHEVTMLQLAEEVERAFGAALRRRTAPLPADDPRQRCPDITKMRERYGWEPRVSLREGLRETINYFRESA
jgi:dTDP-glucose 4,6-dehydratase